MGRFWKYFLIVVFIFFLSLAGYLFYQYNKLSGTTSSILKNNPTLNALVPKPDTRFEFVNNIPGYKVEINNKDNLNEMVSSWNIFSNLPGGIEMGDSNAYIIDKIRLELSLNPVAADSASKVTSDVYEGQNKGGRLVSNSTVSIDKANNVLVVKIYILPDWLGKPTGTVLGTFKDPQTTINYQINYHYAYRLFESSLINVNKLLKMSPTDQQNFIKKEVSGRFSQWMSDPTTFPLKITKNAF